MVKCVYYSISMVPHRREKTQCGSVMPTKVEKKKLQSGLALKSMDRIDICANCPCLPNMMYAPTSIYQCAISAADDMAVIGESIDEVEPT